MARFLDLGPDDNVVTIATDGFDRYPSVLADLERRQGPLSGNDLDARFEEVFRGGGAEISWMCARGNRRSGFSATRKRFGPPSAIPCPTGRHESQSFWDEEFGKIAEIDANLLKARAG